MTNLTSFLSILKVSCILMILIIITPSCTHSSQDSNYGLLTDDFERVISNSPDSCFKLLKINKAKYLTSESDRAKYSLLLSLADYKRGNDAMSDESLKPAIDYYLKNKKRREYLREKMLTAFLYAHYYVNTNQESLAYDMFDNAIDYGTTIDDPNYPAMALHAQGNIYSRLLQGENAILKYKEALDYLINNKGKDEYQILIILSISQNYNSPDSSHIAKDYIEKGLSLSEEKNIHSFLPGLYEELGNYYYYNCMFEESNDAYKKSHSFGHNLSFRDCAYWAESALSSGDSIAYSIRDSINNLSTYSLIDRLTKISMEQAFAKKSEDIEAISALQDSIIVLTNELHFPVKEMMSKTFPSKQSSFNNWSGIIYAVLSILVSIALLYLLLYKFTKTKDDIPEPTDADISTINDLYDKYHKYNTWFRNGKSCIAHDIFAR